MAVYVNNISIDSGANFYRDFYLDDVNGNSIDLTGYTGKSEVRKHPESVGAATTFTLGFVDRPNGRIRLSLTRQETEKIKPGRYCYDVMFTEGQGPSSNAGVWSTLDANNSGSYRGFTINAWSSFMNTYAYSRVPQSGLLSSQPDPYGVKTDSYVVNFPYTGAYQIEAAADNVGTVTINSTTFNAVHYGDTNVGVGSISLEKGNHTVTLTQQNTQSGSDNFADNPVGIAVSITYIGGTAPGKKSIVIEGNILVSPDITPQCIKTIYDKKWGAITSDAGSGGDQPLRAGTGIEVATIDTLDTYGVVIFGYHSNCGSLSNTVATVQANIDKIEQYIANGGVVWFRGEHTTCGDQTQSNQVLADLGTVMRLANPGSTEAAGAANLTKVTSSSLMPEMTSSASNYVELNGANGLYKFGSGYTAAYEKIGNGVVFVQSDVDGSWQTPSDELYEGIRDLVISGNYSYS